MFCTSIYALLLFVEPDSLVICLSLYCYSVVVNYLSLYYLTILLYRILKISRIASVPYHMSIFPIRVWAVPYAYTCMDNPYTYGNSHACMGQSYAYRQGSLDLKFKVYSYS